MELSIADNGSRQATPVSVSIVGKKEKKKEREKLGRQRRARVGGKGVRESTVLKMLKMF
jgi:hypothetical protein